MKIELMYKVNLTLKDKHFRKHPVQKNCIRKELVIAFQERDSQQME